MTRTLVCALFLALLAPVGGASRTAIAADGDASVRTGREALGRFWGYPWYDAKADALREVDPPKPKIDSIPLTSSGGGELLRNLVWIGIAAILLAMVYLLVRFFLNQEADALDEAEQASTAARIEALPFAMRPGWTDLLKEARRCYEQGDCRHAIIYLFSFELVELDRRQLIRLAKGRTNRQYLHDLRHRRDLRGLVEQTMTAFEDVFFGDLDLDRRRFEACFFRVDEFMRLVAPAIGQPVLAGQGASP